jgi:hypothetical protein
MLKKYLFLIAFLLPLFVLGQETPNVVVGPMSKQQKTAIKKQENLKHKQEKAYNKEVKKRYKMQDRETRKRIRESLKEANRVNHNKQKGFFLTRWMKKGHH